MKKFFLLFICLYPLVACSQMSKECQEFHGFTERFTRKMCKKHQLTVYAIGSSIPKKITSIDYDFAYKESVDIDTARKMIVCYAGEMLESINQDVQLRSYLDHYPFNIDDIILSLVFPDVKDCHQENTHPVDVLLIHGEILYSKRELINRKLVEILTESFEEAQKKSQKSSLTY